jgi:hypothetical protein
VVAASGALVGAILWLTANLRHRAIAAFMSLGMTTTSSFMSTVRVRGISVAGSLRMLVLLISSSLG